jgi:DNA-directed RNA polymerase subunit RPC12/RpoP
MNKVNKYSRAGNEGKELACPYCKEKVIVWHFAWVAMTCQKCKRMVDKSEWIIVK